MNDLPKGARDFQALCEGVWCPSVRLRRAEGSDGRTGPPRGVCAACGATTTVNADGGCRVHNADGARCVGSGATPSKLIEPGDPVPVVSWSVSAVWGRHDYAIGTWWDGRFCDGFVWGDLGGAMGTKRVRITELRGYVRGKGQADLR